MIFVKVNDMSFLIEHKLIIFLLFVVLNLVAFIAYGVDKYKAVKNKWRVPESSLILLAVMGGSLGALLGMKTFHHKTKHPKFFIGVPAIIIFQTALIAFITYKYFM